MVTAIDWGRRLALVVGVLCTLVMIRDSYFFERTAMFSANMDVCFERLRRSYVLILTGGPGPGESFFGGTETCFSEVVFYMEKHFPTSLVAALAPLNTLVTDIHWFHKDLKGEGTPTALGSRFTKLEDARQGILERLGSDRRERMRYLEMVRRIFLLSLGVGGVLFLFRLRQDSGERRKTISLEKKRETPAPLPAAVPAEVQERASLADVLAVALDSLADTILLRGIRVVPYVREDSSVYVRSQSLGRVLEVLLGNIFDSFGGEGRLKISEEYRGERIVLVLDWFPAASLPVEQERALDNLILESGGRVESSPGDKFAYLFGVHLRRAGPSFRRETAWSRARKKNSCADFLCKAVRMGHNRCRW